VKFSVRYKSFSGGDDITITWTDGPTGKQVDEIANKYESGTFDAMTDCSGYDHSAYGSAVDAVLGRAKFVSTSRHFSDSLIQKAIDRVRAKYDHQCPAEVTVEAYKTGKLHSLTPFENDNSYHRSFSSLIGQELDKLGMMPKQDTK